MDRQRYAVNSSDKYKRYFELLKEKSRTTRALQNETLKESSVFSMQ
jgi:hypothetical protein